MKTFKKILCLTLSLIMLGSIVSVFAVSAGAADESGIKRISVTINGDTENSRGICWYTPKKSDSIVKVTPADAIDFDAAEIYTGTVASFKANYVHKVTVDKLEPGTKYAYIVGDGTNWSDVGYFETSTGEYEDFSFIAIADVQASNNDNFFRASKVMDAAKNTLPDSKFVANLGDFVNDCTDDEWDWYFDNFSSTLMNTTSVPIAGNHDGNLKWNWFENMFNIGEAEGSKTTTGCYYSFNYGNAHIAVLNTNDMYPMSSEQVNWLKNDMKQSDADWKIVLMHRALYSAGKNINKPDTLIMRSVLLPVMDELGIDLAMAGHDHMYYRSEQVKGDTIQKTTYITEEFNGKATEFAVDPDGTVYILPSTAGTKRYDLNTDAVSPILDVAAKAMSTKDFGVYSTVEIKLNDDNTTSLVFNAYGYNEATEDSTLLDSYAIKKTMGQNVVDPNYEPLPTSGLGAENIMRFVNEFSKVLILYITKVLPAMIFG